MATVELETNKRSRTSQAHSSSMIRLQCQGMAKTEVGSSRFVSLRKLPVDGQGPECSDVGILIPLPLTERALLTG
jgi:hypothetical protein